MCALSLVHSSKLFLMATVYSGTDQVTAIQRCPLLGGSICISCIVTSIRDKWSVPCTEVVHFSEDPLLY